MSQNWKEWNFQVKVALKKRMPTGVPLGDANGTGGKRGHRRQGASKGKVASRFAILATKSRRLDSEAPPGLEMRKTTAPLAQTKSAYSVTQKTKKVKLEVTTDSGAEESVWPMSLLKEVPTLSIVGKKKRFVAANCQELGLTAAKE